MGSKLLEPVRDLYRKNQLHSSDVYLEDHSRNNAVLLREIEAFDSYKQYVLPGGTILDWGCRHAIDSCLLRMTFGNDVDIYACDVFPPETYKVWYDWAQVHYTQLHHPVRLPYGDEEFDSVVGGGVLEHVPHDLDSISELWRVLKIEGHLIITFLPNQLSYTEWLNRRWQGEYHKRRYTKKWITDALKHRGFMPIAIKYHQVIPTLASGAKLKIINDSLIERLYKLNKALERVPLLNLFASNIVVIAQKRPCF